MNICEKRSVRVVPPSRREGWMKTGRNDEQVKANTSSASAAGTVETSSLSSEDRDEKANMNTSKDEAKGSCGYSPQNSREGDQILKNIVEVQVLSNQEKDLDNEDVSDANDGEDEKMGSSPQQDDEEEELDLLVSDSDHKPAALETRTIPQPVVGRPGPRFEGHYRGDAAPASPVRMTAQPRSAAASLYSDDYGSNAVAYSSPRQPVAVRGERLHADYRRNSFDGQDNNSGSLRDSGSQRRRSVTFEGGNEDRSQQSQASPRKIPSKSCSFQSNSASRGEEYAHSSPRSPTMRPEEYAYSSSRQPSLRSEGYAYSSPRQPSKQSSFRHLPQAPYAPAHSADNRYRGETSLEQPRQAHVDPRQRQTSRRSLDLSAHSHMKKKADAAGRMEDLLYELFPKHVARSLRDGRKVEPESFDCVTVCFMDIVGYTVISSKLSAVKISDLLDRLYTKFDDLCGLHEIFKVETVGDAYMTVTNLASRQYDHVKKMVHFVMDAIQVASETLVDVDDPSLGYITMRGGIHSGPVVAHVIGSRTPRYSLIGDTVNTASRMESHSLPGRIQLSEPSATLLKCQGPDVHLQCRGSVPVKGKGDMTTYWVGEHEDNCSIGSDGPAPGAVNMSSNCSLSDLSIGDVSVGSQMSGLTALTEQEQEALEEKLIRMAMEQSMKESESSLRASQSSLNTSQSLGSKGSHFDGRGSWSSDQAPSHYSGSAGYHNSANSMRYLAANHGNNSQLSDHAESMRLAELEQEREMLELAIQLSLADTPGGANNHGAAQPAAVYHSQY